MEKRGSDSTLGRASETAGGEVSSHLFLQPARLNREELFVTDYDLVARSRITDVVLLMSGTKGEDKFQISQLDESLSSYRISLNTSYFRHS